MFATAKKCFATAKLKPRMIAALGSPQRRLLFIAGKRFAIAMVKDRYTKKKDD